MIIFLIHILMIVLCWRCCRKVGGSIYFAHCPQVTELKTEYMGISLAYNTLQYWQVKRQVVYGSVTIILLSLFMFFWFRLWFLFIWLLDYSRTWQIVCWVLCSITLLFRNLAHCMLGLCSITLLFRNLAHCMLGFM